MVGSVISDEIILDMQKKIHINSFFFFGKLDQNRLNAINFKRVFFLFSLPECATVIDGMKSILNEPTTGIKLNGTCLGLGSPIAKSLNYSHGSRIRAKTIC